MNFHVAILILKMEENMQYFWHIMLYYFKKGKNTIKMHENYAMGGEGAVIDWMCQKWFTNFCAREFSLDNAPQLGRPVEVDSNQIETLIENNQHYNNQHIGDSRHTQNIQINKVIGEN